MPLSTFDLNAFNYDNAVRGVFYDEVGNTGGAFSAWLDTLVVQEGAYQAPASAVPEPSSVCLLATGLAVVVFVRRRVHKAWLPRRGENVAVRSARG